MFSSLTSTGRDPRCPRRDWQPSICLSRDRMSAAAVLFSLVLLCPVVPQTKKKERRTMTARTLQFRLYLRAALLSYRGRL
ncbi:hypothetical protein [Pandoravirus japonicus]|uniref:Uncharacterized protein n=1 Tax=Pandoravirus japonicus TaxID=2823154 RepID=A0A811BSR1_9VIRU|nr:hypothetical protein [Pandoravirus japonicus]